MWQTGEVFQQAHKFFELKNSVRFILTVLSETI